jgi:hypothetical protein
MQSTHPITKLHRSLVSVLSVSPRLAQAVVQPGSAAFAREDYLYDANACPERLPKAGSRRGNRTAVERRTAANDTIAAQTDSYTRTAGTNKLASITGGSVVTASYDGHGRLISYARSGEASLSHVYNGMELAERSLSNFTP